MKQKIIFATSTNDSPALMTVLCWRVGIEKEKSFNIELDCGHCGLGSRALHLNRCFAFCQYQKAQPYGHKIPMHSEKMDRSTLNYWFDFKSDTHTSFSEPKMSKI